VSVYIEIIVPFERESESDVLVARLSGIGFEGFEEAEDRLHAFIPEAFYSEAQTREAILQIKESEAGINGMKWEKTGALYSVNRIEPKNWNAEWESHFAPVIIDDFCAIRAHFHERIGTVKHELLITPKMSFGTGHHPSTHMMIEAMRGLDFRGASVLDFGTGTGVLAILASKLGAAGIRAIDLDPRSIENARENIAANQAGPISVEQKDHLRGEGIFDIILANINLQVLLASLPDLQQHLTEKGVIIASGVLQSDEERLRTGAAANGFLMNILFIRGNWMSFNLKKG
jgi:ribosomal protein L11 methyltransferase